MKKLILAPSLSLCLLFLPVMNFAIAAGNDYSILIDRQADQIKNLSSRVELLENAISDLRNQLKSDIIADPANHGLKIPSPATPDHPASGQTGDDQIPGIAEKSAVSQEKKDYDTALAALKDNKLEEAESLFAEFIEKHPGSSLQSNAIFWYGETFFRRDQFNKAAINYLKGYKSYPKGNKAADSLLKLSFSLAGLNKNQEACNMLGKLEKEFPDRPASSLKRASDAKAKFGCK